MTHGWKRVLAAGLAVLMLSGCGQRTGTAAEDLEKDRYYQVLDAQGQEVRTLTAETEIDALETLVNSFTQGEARPLGDQAVTPLYTYVLWQEETLKAGEDPAEERAYLQALTLTVQENSDTVVLEVLPDGTAAVTNLLTALAPQADSETLAGLLKFCYEVPPETAEALRDPAGWK